MFSIVGFINRNNPKAKCGRLNRLGCIKRNFVSKAGDPYCSLYYVTSGASASIPVMAFSKQHEPKLEGISDVLIVHTCKPLPLVLTTSVIASSVSWPPPPLKLCAFSGKGLFRLVPSTPRYVPYRT